MLNDIVISTAEFAARALPFECMDYMFMKLALLALLILAPLAAVTGIQVVNSRMSFFSDAVSHSAFAGVALGTICGIAIPVSMPLVAVAVALLIMYLKRSGRLSGDTVTGVVFSAVAAFGLAVMARDRSGAAAVQMFLYGEILTISPEQIAALAVLLLVFILFQLFSFNRLLLLGVNPMLASVHKVRVGLYQYLFAALLALVVIESLHTAGVILVTALLVIPAAAARNLARSTIGMFYWALAVSYISCIGGLLISAQEWANVPAGAAIVLVSAAIFFISTLVAACRPRRSSDTEN